MTNSADNPLSINSPEILNQLRQLLTNSGFITAKAVEGIKLLSVNHQTSDTGRKENDSMPSLSDSDFSQPLETLLRLFIFGASIRCDLVAKAITPMKLNDFFDMGLLVDDGGMVYAELQLMVYKNTVFAVDFKSGDLSKNHVIGITAATQTLENLTIRSRVNSTLDIGTGTGIQALIAARHSNKVIATDINARAVNVATFNAWLNGFAIDCRVGNMLEPVKDEKFDLIISCPPFVISPDDRFHYVDSGHPGDQFLEKLIISGIQCLNENGFFQVMCQVVQYGEQPWSERIASWLDGQGCDAWMLYRNTMTPEEHARMWVPERTESSEQTVQEWIHYYDKSGITSIASGLLTVRKNNAHDNWFQVSQIPGGVGYCGHSIENGFNARDFLDIVDDEDLLDALLVLPKDIEIQQNGHTIKHTKGLIFVEAIDDVMLPFLKNCDGKQTVGEAIIRTESQLGEIDKKIHLNQVRKLVLNGFLALHTA